MAHLTSENIWAHMRVLRRFRAPIMMRDHEGKLYVADTQGPQMLALRCDCGHEWEIRQDEFPGRRKLKNCGRPQCPHVNSPGRSRFRERGSTCSVYLSNALAAQVDTYASALGVSFSRGLERLARSAFAMGAVPGAVFPGVTQEHSTPEAEEEPD